MQNLSTSYGSSKDRREIKVLLIVAVAINLAALLSGCEKPQEKSVFSLEAGGEKIVDVKDRADGVRVQVGGGENGGHTGIDINVGSDH